MKRFILAAVAAVLCACGADAEGVEGVDEIEGVKSSDGSDVGDAEDGDDGNEAAAPASHSRVVVLEDVCDTHWIETVDGAPYAHPVSVYAVRTSAVRLAWACDQVPSDHVRPGECVGVLPWLTRFGEVVVPCEDDEGREYRTTRLVIEVP